MFSEILNIFFFGGGGFTPEDLADVKRPHELKI
jgi:hypothetical protein